MVKGCHCGHLKRRPSFNFVLGDQRCRAMTSRNECAFEFRVCHLERANSKRYGNGASSEETQIKAQTFCFSDRGQPDGASDFRIDLSSQNDDFEILSIKEGACD